MTEPKEPPDEPVIDDPEDDDIPDIRNDDPGEYQQPIPDTLDEDDGDG